VLEKAVLLNPSNSGARSSLAQVLLARGQLDEAIQNYRTVLSAEPGNGGAYLNLGIVLQRKGRTGEALEHFTKGAHLCLPDADTRFNFGLALLETAHPVEAAAQFRAGLRLRPAESRMHYRLAVALSQQHKLQEAAIQYRETLRLAPEFADALSGLAWILASAPGAELRNGAEAVKLAERACGLSVDPEPSVLVTLAAAYAEAGDFSKAVEISKRARERALARGEQEYATRAEESTNLYAAGRCYRDK
jgi:tetratricopeptide (TPR) repeat protein